MTEQLLLPIGFSDSASFENYYPGRSAEVVDGLRALMGGDASGPYYIYGGEGTGKSHLLYALLTGLLARGELAQYLCLSDPGVSVNSVELVDASGWVCVDDIDAWSKSAEKEQCLFRLFEKVRDQAGNWVATASRRPSDIGLDLADLASRLGSGVAYRLQELNHDERRAALLHRAHSRGFKIGDEALAYLLTRTSRSTSDLFSLLDRIDRATLQEGRRVTVPFLRTLL